MNILVYITLFGWPLVILVLFQYLPPRRAVIAAFFGAWLFLPETGFKAEALPAYTKATAASYGVLLATVLFQPRLLLAFRPKWIDIPAAVWTIVPLFSSVTVGRGWYDGISGVIANVIVWTLPYFLGRVYFTDLEGLFELACGTFFAALAYVPFILVELRMGPQLHEWVYGFATLPWFERMRFGGWRPSVFMRHGLMLAMFILTALQTSFWLARTGGLKRLWRYSIWWYVGLLAVLMVLTKSTGAIAIAILVMAFSLMSMTRWRIWLLILAAIPPAYITARMTGVWDGQNITTWVGANVDEGRAGSYDTRRQQEDSAIAKVMQRPLFGWTTWLGGGDSLWAITATCSGLVGLTALFAIFMIPAILTILQIRGSAWENSRGGAAIALAVGCLAFLIDSLFNGMYNPVMIVGAGALGSSWPAIRALGGCRQSPMQLTHVADRVAKTASPAPTFVPVQMNPRMDP